MRRRVVDLPDIDVRVELKLACLSFGITVEFGRQPPQRQLLQSVEQRLAAGAKMARDARSSRHDLDGDSRVLLGELLAWNWRPATSTVSRAA